MRLWCLRKMELLEPQLSRQTSSRALTPPTRQPRRSTGLASPLQNKLTQTDVSRAIKEWGLPASSVASNYIFCASHRHSNKHNCTFDYKAMGRESVAKANPAVIAEKMDKVRTCRHFQRGATQRRRPFTVDELRITPNVLLSPRRSSCAPVTQ